MLVITIKLVTDFTGVVVEREQISRGNPISYSCAIGVSEYIVSKRPEKIQYFDNILQATEDFEKGRVSHKELVRIMHNNVADILAGLRKDDVLKYAMEYWTRGKKRVEPHYLIRQILADVRLYGGALVVSGDPSIFIEAYNKVVLNPMSIEFKDEYIIGLEPTLDETGCFVAERKTIQTTEGEKEIIVMQKDIDTPKAKLDAVLGIMKEKDLLDAVVLGDTSFESELFNASGCPLKVRPTQDLLDYDKNEYEKLHKKRMGELRLFIEYINRTREILDFVYSLPYIMLLENRNGYVFKIRRELADTFDKRIYVDVEPSGHVFARPISLFPPRSGHFPIDIPEEQFKGFAKNRHYTREQMSDIWDIVKAYRQMSKISQLPPPIIEATRTRRKRRKKR